MYKGGKKHKKNKGASRFVIQSTKKERKKEALNYEQMTKLLNQFKLNNPKEVELVYDIR